MGNDQLSVVSNAKRETTEFRSFYYVWIPMTNEEKELFAPDIENAAWRIKVYKENEKV